MTPGAKLRKARNLIKTFESAYKRGDIYLPDGKTKAHWVARYEKACALVLAHLLSKAT